MIEEKELIFVAEQLNISKNQVKNTIKLLEGGNTVPFIARYRKEKTGNLNETEILGIKDYLQYFLELNERKETVLKTIKEQGKLTDELEERIKNTLSKAELEDIYLPFKPKRRTKATRGKEMGLEPLADAILRGDGLSIEDMAEAYLDEKKGVDTIDKAIEFAGYILAEYFSENAELRGKVRALFKEKGRIKVKVAKDFEEKRTKYEMYYDFCESVSDIPSHRILAIRRGEREKVLRSKIDVDVDTAFNLVYPLFFSESHVFFQYLKEWLYYSLKRLVFPSIELETRLELKKRADLEAIDVFAKNLENLLLMPPAGNIPVLGVDPGFRTGCKIVAVNETGKFMYGTTIYPTKPREDFETSRKVSLDIIERFGLKVVVIGNGTASKETRDFFKSIVPDGVRVVVVSEAGASVYSASKVAIEEFPDLDVTMRGAISIARRFQDPLSELVKIEPKAIGVGQYQHDVNQTLLKKKLDSVVVSVVNRVGVDLNTASFHLLKYISGINERVAREIVNFRNNNGMFKTRHELLSIPNLGPKTFEQSAGFLRIRNGSEILDSTGIHPESYWIVDRIAEKLKVGKEELVGNGKLLESLAHDIFVEGAGEFTLNDVLKELINPGRDPRSDFEFFDFNDGVNDIDDIEEGMVLNGVVTNVTRFGVFVDLGVHQDGLVHISEISNDFVKNIEDFVSVGQRVRINVIKVDRELSRISLSMKAVEKRSPLSNNKKKGLKRFKERKGKKEVLINKLIERFGNN